MTAPPVTIPFPQKMKREKLDGQFAKFLEILKQIHINIPFTDALLQMPSYAKFLKEILSSKRKLEEVSVFADQCTKKPKEIIENVLVRVDKFVFPVDFIVLEMKECPDEPIILGRPFLATGRAIIDVHQGQLILRVDEERVIFDMQKILRFLGDEASSSYFSIDMISDLADEFKDDQLISDSMERCLTKSEQEERLIQVLKAHKGALGWTIEDIKGISPAIFTHRILMEDIYKPIIQPQKRLNPAMQEVVKKEIVKLLAACIIYPI
ncbi:uncharacterized protein [Nicotiana tomentosiformis]|uniref:uncharacterized protein n=1 Tax=Nicotiana tomentosiformis TaxID=4098 RepID=UPI00388C8B79